MPTTKKPVIEVRGARVNNLKDVNADVPRDSFVVVTGLSGSGKSSFVFDTIYAEANRRYMESLSSYARNFMEAFDKPDVDAIRNLIPSISIDQKSVSRSPRSTVGTMTEVYDYLRLLFAKEGVPHCPTCGKPLSKRTPREILSEILSAPDGTSAVFLAEPAAFVDKDPDRILELAAEQGYVRVRIDGEVVLLADVRRDGFPGGTYPDRIEVVIDRLLLDTARPDKERILDSLETAFRAGQGAATVVLGDEERRYLNLFLCEECGVALPDFTPSHFSFNNPDGACPRCAGLGVTLEFDPDLVIPNRELSLLEGAIRPLAKTGGERGSGNGPLRVIEDTARRNKIPLNVPVKKLTKRQMDVVLFGEKDREGFPGIIAVLEQKYRDARSDHFRAELEECMQKKPCPECGARRLRPEPLSVLIDGANIDDLSSKGVADLRVLLKGLASTHQSREKRVTDLIFREMEARLAAIEKVGLGYLALSRGADTISGGEAQRLRLSTQMRAGLSGILYVLDEPSVGLHSRDTDRLIDAILELREGGNSLVVVEHDRAIMKRADHIIDFGPGAGRLGGEIIFSGTPEKLFSSKSATGEYLSGKRNVSNKEGVRKGNAKYIEIVGAREHNLRNVDVRIPLGTFVAVSGVSGSGKSSLVDDILSRALARKFYDAKAEPGAHDRIDGLEHIDKVITVNQDPIGRTPRSNAATYTGIFNHVRDLFAATPEAERERFDASHFSFNMKGGRCEACQGGGMKKIEMYLLPDMYVPCEICGGTRYNQKTLAVTYRGMNIAQVLDMTVSEARTFFLDQPQIEEKLRTLEEVGLDYLVLGQSAPTLSGGEAQRVKLATELARKSSGNTLYILDEPTTGLHFEDVRKLLDVLDALVEKGNTVLVVEHSTDVINHADWVIELGPDGGDGGGELVFAGTPKDLRRCKKSPTAKYL
ncbi:MAG: excinuclease ABC subunit UvrA [Candidatus Moranbacteria bacterium]|nr:excinuclease ABC subunit UvrA [Candidatus Moranbacteria bacterium]NTW46320.1 excinuclease ABC subunit UvrA [Candidatus Moranbacteria bacterium]